MKINSLNNYYNNSVIHAKLRIMPHYANTAKNSDSFSFTGKSKPIYCISINGDIEYYPKLSEAAQKMNMSPASILTSITSKSISKEKYQFVYANELETIEDGRKILNTEKLNEIQERFKTKVHTLPLYAVDINYNIHRFKSQKQAEEELDIFQNTISQCVMGLRDGNAGYIFVNARDVETYLSNGTTTVDKYKLIRKAYEYSCKKAIYAIDKNGQYKKYPSKLEALKQTEDKKNDIIFVRPEEIETLCDDGEVIINCDKIEEIAKYGLKKNPNEWKNTPMYVIDKDGNTKKFNSGLEAVKEFNLNPNQLADCRRSGMKILNDMCFVIANRIEIANSSGKIELNNTLLNEIIKKINNQFLKSPIYAIDAKGSYKRYAEVKYAAKDCETNSGYIYQCLKGEKITCKGYTFVNAKDVEYTDKNGNTVLDEDKLKEINKSKRLAKGKCIPVYIIKPDKKVSRAYSINDAERKTCIGAGMIQRCINGEKNFIDGYTFIEANGIDIYDENGKAHLDKEKLVKIYQERKNNENLKP